MSNAVISSVPLSDFSLWKKLNGKRALISFDIELTARCNNNCRHCYINLPAADSTAKGKELSFEEIKEIADEAVSLGALWCLITGGEPLLRNDFWDIYFYLKQRGLLVSVFTNATLITKEHVKFFKKYPPREIEVSVYGITRDTYERVTRKPASFVAFMRGLNLLLKAGVKVRLKAMALRSNFHELLDIASFCRQKTCDYFRFDPFLHLRFDGNRKRNEEIKAERLSPSEITALEQSDPKRINALEKECKRISSGEFIPAAGNHIFQCGAGFSSFYLSYDGLFRLCSALCHPNCCYNLKKRNLSDAWHRFVPRVRDFRSERPDFLKTCHVCSQIDFCMWCPAHTYLETKELDAPVDYFCQVTQARIKALKITQAPFPCFAI